MSVRAQDPVPGSNVCAGTPLLQQRFERREPLAYGEGVGLARRPEDREPVATGREQPVAVGGEGGVVRRQACVHRGEDGRENALRSPAPSWSLMAAPCGHYCFGRLDGGLGCGGPAEGCWPTL